MQECCPIDFAVKTFNCRDAFFAGQEAKTAGLTFYTFYTIQNNFKLLSQVVETLNELEHFFSELEGHQGKWPLEFGRNYVACKGKTPTIASDERQSGLPCFVLLPSFVGFIFIITWTCKSAEHSP